MRMESGLFAKQLGLNSLAGSSPVSSAYRVQSVNCSAVRRSRTPLSTWASSVIGNEHALPDLVEVPEDREGSAGSIPVWSTRLVS